MITVHDSRGLEQKKDYATITCQYRATEVISNTISGVHREGRKIHRKYTMWTLQCIYTITV